jgi:hypothetical protein
MPEKPDLGPDSLEIVELVMAIEEALSDARLTPNRREQLYREIDAPIRSVDFGEPSSHEFKVRIEQLIREIKARIESGEFGNEGDFDDDALGASVRNLGPRSPRGEAGAAAKPEEPYSES